MRWPREVTLFRRRCRHRDTTMLLDYLPGCGPAPGLISGYNGVMDYTCRRCGHTWQVHTRINVGAPL